MTDWITEYNMEQPSELQQIAPTTYIQRKNIRQTTQLMHIQNN